ncbi:hypothetical protein GEO60473_31830 [Geobacter sp. 60473]|nr:hypothetical protein GEO60473_31830 [Geobacter sp. 60473]
MTFIHEPVCIEQKVLPVLPDGVAIGCQVRVGGKTPARPAQDPLERLFSFAAAFFGVDNLAIPEKNNTASPSEFDGNAT